MLLLYGINFLVLFEISQAGFERPGITISELLHSITTSLAGDRIEGRSGTISGDCRVDGVDYPEGSYVPLDAIRRCQCEGGVITQYCKFPSFQVTTNFNVDKKNPGRVPGKDKQELLPRFQAKTNSPMVQVTNQRKLVPRFQVDTRAPATQMTNQRKLLPNRAQVTNNHKLVPRFQADTKAHRVQGTNQRNSVPRFQADFRAPRVRVTNQQKVLPGFSVDAKAQKFQKQHLLPGFKKDAIVPKLLPSFQVQTNFGVKKLKVTENIQKFPNLQVETRPTLLTQGEKSEAAKDSRSKPRKSSGRGKARLFRLFAEEKKPVTRTSNDTGCHVRGQFYNFPVVKVPEGATCRCTDEGMLWCWNFGIPTCTGCFVDGTFMDVGHQYKLKDGTECSCHCGRQAGNQVCMAGTVARNGGIV